MGAAADRADDLLGLGRREDELHVRRRLLDELEQRVEARRRDHVGLVDDVDLVAAVHRSEERPLAQVARIVDTAVGGRVDLDDVDAARPAARQVAARLAVAAGLGRRAVLAVEGAGKDARARGLAAAARAGEQVRVVDAVVGQRPLERLGDVLLADDVAERVGTVAPVQRQWRLRDVRCPRRRHGGGLDHGDGLDHRRRLVDDLRGSLGLRHLDRRRVLHGCLRGLLHHDLGRFAGRVEEARAVLVPEVQLVVLVVHAPQTMRAVRQSLPSGEYAVAHQRPHAPARAAGDRKNHEVGSHPSTTIRGVRCNSRLRLVEVPTRSPRRSPLLRDRRALTAPAGRS